MIKTIIVGGLQLAVALKTGEYIGEAINYVGKNYSFSIKKKNFKK